MFCPVCVCQNYILNFYYYFRVPEPIQPFTERTSEVEPVGERQRPTYSPYASTVREYSAPPRPVLNNEETATLPGERKVPENEWTQVNVRQGDCPTGFEVNDNGGCFGEFH